MKLDPSEFFDLSEYAHRRLFEDLEHVWQALDRLPEHLAATCRALTFGRVADQAVLEGAVFVGEEAVVAPGAMVVGPAIIGAGSEIRHGALLRGPVVLGIGCVVGHGTEVKASVLLDGAKAPHLSYVGDSILGNRVNLGAGTVCANLRLDGREVQVAAAGPGQPRLPTGRQKLGAIIGDDAVIGCHTVLNPGALIPRRAAVPPCSCITGRWQG